MIRVLLADDHAVVRQGLRTFLDLQDDIEVVAEAADGEVAVDAAQRTDPDVILLDLVMPRLDGVGALKRLHGSRARVIVLTSFGDGGRQPGQFYGVHSIAVDSQGNIYTTETYEGKRVQKFVFRGLAPIPGESQGALWPQ